MVARNQDGLGGLFDIIGNFLERLFGILLSFIEGLSNIGRDDD